MLGFSRKSILFAHIVQELCIHVHGRLLVENKKKMAVRGGFSPFSGPNCKIVNSFGQGNFKFVRGKSKNFRTLSLWQPC